MPLMEDQILEAHFAGATLTEIAELEQVRSPETARKRLAEAKREHIISLAGQLLLARRAGQCLWFVIPTTEGNELSTSLRYFSWVVTELEGLRVQTRIHVEAKPDGVAFGLEELSATERLHAEEAQA